MPGCVFMDLDGTIFNWGSNDFLPGAVTLIKAILKDGNQIIFTTQRPSAIGVDLALKREGITGLPILSQILNPRLVVNDAGAYAHDHLQNAPWSADEIRRLLLFANG